MARLSNITLSSITDLEENAEEEKIELKLFELRRRHSRVHDRLYSLMVNEQSRISAVPGADLQHVTTLAGLSGSIDSALSSAEAGQWPVTYFEWSLSQLRPSVAQNGIELLARLDEIFQRLENEVTKQEDSARAAGWERSKLPSPIPTDISTVPKPN